jgi:hypothetical protein
LNNQFAALREFKQISIKQFPIPGEPGFPLVGLLPSPGNKGEGDNFRAYFKQAREELTVRLCERLFNPDGTKNKWWQVCMPTLFYYYYYFLRLFILYIIYFLCSHSQNASSWEKK